MNLFQAENIYSMSYADFVSFIGIDNTPPGGIETINIWMSTSFIKSNSTLLDLACNSGFSSRYIAEKQQGVRVNGIDLSEAAISEANEIAYKLGYNNLQYHVANAESLPFEENSFTHIVAGCSFGFIQQKEQVVSECYRVLNKGGYLCVSDFYYIKEIPNNILSEVNKVVDFKPSKLWDKAYWEKLYNTKFKEILSIDRDIKFYTDKQIEDLCFNYISNSRSLKKYSFEVKEASYKRLVYTRKILNQHGKFQRYRVCVYQK